MRSFFSQEELLFRIQIVRAASVGQYANGVFILSELWQSLVSVVRKNKNKTSQQCRAESMHRTIMNMARFMIVAGGLPLFARTLLVGCCSIRCIAVRYLQSRYSPMWHQHWVRLCFFSPCSVYRDPKKNNFAKRPQRVLIIEIGDGNYGYHVFLPKNRTVDTTLHEPDLETLDKEQNNFVTKTRLWNALCATRKMKRHQSIADARPSQNGQRIV